MSYANCTLSCYIIGDSIVAQKQSLRTQTMKLSSSPFESTDSIVPIARYSLGPESREEGSTHILV